MRIRNTAMPQKVSKWLVALLSGALLASTTFGARIHLPFTVKVSGSNVGYFTLISEYGGDISRVEVTIGQSNYNFDHSYKGLTPGNVSTASFDPSSGSLNTVIVKTTGFNALDELNFYIDLDEDGKNNGVDLKKILFNNSGSNNSRVRVYNSSGDYDELTMTDGPASAAVYTFQTDSRPPVISVRSIAGLDELGDPIPVANCTVKIDGQVAYQNLGSKDNIQVFHEQTVEITAPQFVFMDKDRNYLTDSTRPDADDIRNSMQRFEAIGISANDILQSGDPTLYQFVVSDNAQITVKWRHDYALRIDSNFAKTGSNLEGSSSSNLWAGKLESKASGNPMPSVQLHWKPSGDLVTATIDGSVIDYTHPGLDIRYVPIGYAKGGSANGTDIDVEGTNTFNVGQAPPARQQIEQFTMTGPASITYLWQIQFGVSVNVDDLSRSQVGVVREDIGNSSFIDHTGEGTFWFDPGTKVQVLARSNDGAAEENLLSGWVNGDGYYFGSNGELDRTDSSLITGEPNPVAADWITNVTLPGGSPEETYAGFKIDRALAPGSQAGLQRPVRVLWTYGKPVIAITVPIGLHCFYNALTNSSGRIYDGSSFLQTPLGFSDVEITGANTAVSTTDLTVWDPNAARLFPVVPGKYHVNWVRSDDDVEMEVIVTAIYPSEPHYPHIANTPAVNLDPADDDAFIFKEIKYTENEASVDDNALFEASKVGYSVLLFGKIQKKSRGQPKEYVEVRVVKTDLWTDRQHANLPAIIGQRLTDSALDLAQLGTGYVLFSNARYNPFIYDATKLAGLGAPSVYDLDALNLTQTKTVLYPENLPGSIIPVNLHPGAAASERIVVVWYDDPSKNDNLLWPHAARAYDPQWPTTAAEGLGRIVIASQLGSDTPDAQNNDQLTAEAITNQVLVGDALVENITPAETSFNPTRLQQAMIYNQPDRTQPGFNPNEEHALMAPSLRYAAVSPRPLAAYALRDNDLNVTTQNASYTSDPFVLVQYFDTADEQFKMKVYEIEAESTVPAYRFASSSLWADPAALDVNTLRLAPHVTMIAGEPVIPFYPLGVVIGAVPTPETKGSNITAQLTYWEDTKQTSWAVSGGTDAWFTQMPYYPLQPDFWWPAATPGKIGSKDGTDVARIPQVGDSLAFLPNNIGQLKALSDGAAVEASIAANNEAKEILYKSDWPDVAPILKAGETLTYSGGEYRADHPTTTTIDENGHVITVSTPGLPAVLAFAAAEVVFDSANPTGSDSGWLNQWTARVGQVLETRAVDLAFKDFPAALAPAGGKTRISQGKYVFNELPASLQKRIRYDATYGKLELFGIVNDRIISDSDLTAAPPAVYVLEPNILTAADVTALNALDASTQWRAAVAALQAYSVNPSAISSSEPYLVGLEQKINTDPVTGLPLYSDATAVPPVISRDATQAAPLKALGPGLALFPNADFMDMTKDGPDIGWITVVENNDASLGGSPITPHIIKVDRRERYRGAIKTVLSDNVFDENMVLRHQGDFGAHADQLYFEWWYRPDDGSVNVPPPDQIPAGDTNPWKIFPDTSGARGKGQYEILLKGNPNAPETLLADTWWFARYRHENDVVDGVDWSVEQPTGIDGVNYTWSGAGNSDPFNDFDLDGIMDYKAQLAMGWIKRVLDAVNPYEARIRDFEGDSPSTVASMLQQFGPRYEGPVALNPDKDVIENVGLIELYETILNRARSLSIDLSRPISTPAIANALQLASTRLSDFYTLLANEAYTDALNPTIGFGSSSTTYGNLAPSVFTFQNQLSSLLEEELGLLRGLDDNFARPVYNRLFWNFTKGEGEAAYALNYNISDINMDGFIDEDDAFKLYPQGHGDAWGHYLTALTKQYDLLTHSYFNWVSRSESYNLMDIVIKVDFLDERKFAQIAAAKAKAGAEVVDLTYRENYVADPTAQWQGYTDSNPDRAWGVQGWARRAGQGAYFDWVTANALLPSQHPNKTLEGIQKVDRTSNSDIAVISANLNNIQTTFDNANKGYNPLGLDKDVMAFDIVPKVLGGTYPAQTHFEQIYARAVDALANTKVTWDKANEIDQQLRRVGTSEADFRNATFQEDLSYRNRLIQLFGRPYAGTIGSGQLYPAGYDGPDLALHMYVDVREITNETVPGPSTSFAAFNTNGTLTAGGMYDAFNTAGQGQRLLSLNSEWRDLYAPTFTPDTNNVTSARVQDGLYNVNYTDLLAPKVPLEGLTDLMPVTTAGYTFQAPEAWGDRLAVGELQIVLSQMLQQEAKVAEAIGAWDGLSGSIIRQLRLIDARILHADDVQLSHEVFSRVKKGIEGTISGLEAGSRLLQAIGDTVLKIKDASVEAFPHALPTAGLAFSPGDALAPGRAGVTFAAVGTFSGFKAADEILAATKTGFEIALSIAENELELWEGREDLKLQKKEWLESVESMVGDEPVLRIAIFRELQALSDLSNRYRTLLDEGARLVDERAAFNKRVAAQTQLNRYQDMTFRVARNHALSTYRNSFDLAAKYAYLAARAYDFETNFAATDPGSPQALLSDIVKARGIGLMNGTPQFGGGGLAAALAWLKTNYDVVSSQMGINNPQLETGKISLRTELFRILPKGATQPNASVPSPGNSSDDLWKQTLLSSVVDDLWDVSEFRQHCRPFAPEADDQGTHVPQPGLVLRFSTDVQAGKNMFGWPLSGSDHAYDPSVFATKIFATGVWFSDYLSDDLQNDLPDAPRIYMIPVGLDVMSVPTAANPDIVRRWNIVDQRIPVPIPAVSSDLERSDWVPLYDSLSGQYGENRRFSSFRAYHNGGSTVNDDELVNDTRLFGRSIRNTQWVMIIPGVTFNSDPEEGLRRFIDQVSDIQMVFQTYGISGN